MTRHPYDSAQDRELARWLGVTWTREIGAKHFRIVLNFRGQSRFCTYPSSPSDGRRGALNHVQNIRQTLKELGAERSAPAPSSGVRRTRNTTLPKRFSLGERPVKSPSRDPWQALRSLLENSLDGDTAEAESRMVEGR